MKPAMILLALGALTLAGCANPRSEAARAAPTALAGLPKETLYSCAGIPDRVDPVEGGERLTYVRRTTLTHVETDYDDVTFGRYTFIRPRTSVHRQNFQCEAVFSLRDGVVQDISYGPGRDLELCGTIVENCVPLAASR